MIDKIDNVYIREIKREKENTGKRKRRDIEKNKWKEKDKVIEEIMVMFKIGNILQNT